MDTTEHTHIYIISPGKYAYFRNTHRAMEIDGEDEEIEGIFSLIRTSSVAIFSSSSSENLATIEEKNS